MGYGFTHIAQQTCMEEMAKHLFKVSVKAFSSVVVSFIWLFCTWFFNAILFPPEKTCSPAVLVLLQAVVCFIMAYSPNTCLK